MIFHDVYNSCEIIRNTTMRKGKWDEVGRARGGPEVSTSTDPAWPRDDATGTEEAGEVPLATAGFRS